MEYSVGYWIKVGVSQIAKPQIGLSDMAKVEIGKTMAEFAAVQGK